jgi:hypothetical protein
MTNQASNASKLPQGWRNRDDSSRACYYRAMVTAAAKGDQAAADSVAAIDASGWTNPSQTVKDAAARLNAAHSPDYRAYAQLAGWRLTHRIGLSGGNDADRVGADWADANALEAMRENQLRWWRINHAISAGTDADRVAADWADAVLAEVERTVTASELAVRESGRAKIIAAIHAYADFLAAHPSIPAPQYLDGRSHVRREDEPDVLMRVAMVEAFAEREGAELHVAESCVFAELPVASSLMHAIRITHTMLTGTRPERSL